MSRGARSRYRLSTRVTHRSVGSLTWESAEMSLLSAIADLLTSVVILGHEVLAEERHDLSVDGRQHGSIEARRVVQRVAHESGEPRRQRGQQRAVAPMGNVRHALARRAGLKHAFAMEFWKQPLVAWRDHQPEGYARRGQRAHVEVRGVRHRRDDGGD